MTASILIEEKPWAALARPRSKRPRPRFRRQRPLRVAALRGKKFKRKTGSMYCELENMQTQGGVPDAVFQMKNVDLKIQTGLVQCLYLNLFFSFNKV